MMDRINHIFLFLYLIKNDIYLASLFSPILRTTYHCDRGALCIRTCFFAVSTKCAKDRSQLFSLSLSLVFFILLSFSLKCEFCHGNQEKKKEPPSYILKVETLCINRQVEVVIQLKMIRPYVYFICLFEEQVCVFILPIYE